MKRILLILIAVVSACLTLDAQDVYVSNARFSVGDDAAWSNPSFNDSKWQVLALDRDWNQQGVSNENGYGWYRLHVVIPSALKKGITDKVLLDLGPIDDADETWINGRKVGKTGRYPSDDGGYSGRWSEDRRYVVNSSDIRWDKENVIAVKVYNSGDPGGFYAGSARVGKPLLSDLVSMTLEKTEDGVDVVFNALDKSSGFLKVSYTNALTDEVELEENLKLNLSNKKETRKHFTSADYTRFVFEYIDSRCEEVLTQSFVTPYILTPPAPATPRYNGPAVFGVRPGSPVIYRLAFSGEKPMKYSVEGLPEGVVLDADRGVLSGSVAEEGEYPLTFTATNAKGSTSASFTLYVGEDKIALTPPMGWNSWNCWGLSVSQEKVMQSASALISRGLADYGYSYINIDDAWEAEERAADGSIQTNEKFPDMKALGDWLHENGLKMGIYSSPGARTCGGYLGSLGHEEQDAKTWNDWGVDYLKYDWCGYSKVFNPLRDHSVASYVRPYLKMQEYLRQQPRDIFYSLCQYGMAEVWKWGHAVDANSWRTTGDINDTWESVSEIGFNQQKDLYPYAAPGHWNDPDMLVVGKVGWSDQLRDSRLTPDEQYAHITLWSLLASNMLIGCPIEQIDDFTFSLLCNHEVNAVNQDVLGKQARQMTDEDNIQIWARELSDGSMAVGIFNLNDNTVEVDLAGALAKIEIFDKETVRDLWRQKDIPMGIYSIPSHGVRYIKVR